MLSVVVNWLYILFSTFSLGYAFFYFVEKKLHYKVKSVDSILMAGLIIATVYAQIFSLFYKVGLLAVVLLTAAALLILILLRKALLQDLRQYFQKPFAVRMIFSAVLFLAWAYFTSRGYMHYDSDLYHAQSIRWIEEYGIVKGLGNLHERFSYNSSSFALTALYSMKFMLGQSLHTLSGFFAFVLSLSVLKISVSFKRKRFILSDFACVAAVYYLTTITEEVVAPASDYTIMCLIFYIVIKWLRVQEETEPAEKTVPMALLCVAGCYAVTVKLTAGLILLLVMMPAYTLLKEKRVKEILLYLSMGLFVALPWMVRTVWISGWLIYPYTGLDLFSVDWKMDPQRIEADAANIKTWGRALYNGALVNVPVTEWFGNWFYTTLSSMEKLLILADIACVGITFFYALWTILRKKWQNLNTVLMLVTLMCSYLFWQLSAPLMRYGYAYVLLLAALTAGILIRPFMEKPVYFLVLLYGAYKLYMTADYIYDTCRLPYYVKQEDYGTYELYGYETDGVVIYAPVSGDRVGYADFPATPVTTGFKLRGDSLSDGFRGQ